MATASKFDKIIPTAYVRSVAFLFSLRLVFFCCAEFDGLFSRSIFFLFEFRFFFGAVWRTKSFFLVLKKHGIFSIRFPDMRLINERRDKQKQMLTHLLDCCHCHPQPWMIRGMFPIEPQASMTRFDRSHESGHVDRSLTKWGEVIKSSSTRWSWFRVFD